MKCCGDNIISSHHITKYRSNGHIHRNGNSPPKLDMPQVNVPLQIGVERGGGRLNKVYQHNGKRTVLNAGIVHTHARIKISI